MRLWMKLMGGKDMKIKPIQAFEDNYIWLIEKEGRAAVVDPGEAAGVKDYLQENDLALAAVLLTHKHDDHTAGVDELVREYPGTPVYGPVECAQWISEPIQEGDSFDLLGERFEVMKTAGHTEEHISYLMGGHLFCGDALFYAGCGRVFTGDYRAQYDSLQLFSQLPDGVKVYAGHEYTLTNLEFAHSIAPDNAAVEETLNQVRGMREKNQVTLPSTIGQEKKVNLFMQAEDVQAFKELRDQRDNF